jgi:hypothetical protein
MSLLDSHINQPVRGSWCVSASFEDGINDPFLKTLKKFAETGEKKISFVLSPQRVCFARRRRAVGVTATQADSV